MNYRNRPVLGNTFESSYIDAQFIKPLIKMDGQKPKRLTELQYCCSFKLY